MRRRDSACAHGGRLGSGAVLRRSEHLSYFSNSHQSVHHNRPPRPNPLAPARGLNLFLVVNPGIRAACHRYPRGCRSCLLLLVNPLVLLLPHRVPSLLVILILDKDLPRRRMYQDDPPTVPPPITAPIHIDLSADGTLRLTQRRPRRLERRKDLGLCALPCRAGRAWRRILRRGCIRDVNAACHANAALLARRLR